MLTVAQKLELAKAGYTKKEIESMSEVGATEVADVTKVDNSTMVEYNVDEDESENVESVVESGAESNDSVVQQMKNEFNGFMKEMQREMQESMKAMQKFNVQHDRIQVQKPESVDDILGKIINPPLKEREKGE